MYRLEVSTEQTMQFIDITEMVQRVVKASGIIEGQVLVYLPHTTAGVTVNENADPDVVNDLLVGIRTLLPNLPVYRHQEGNSQAHLLSTLVGMEKRFIVEKGQLCLGTWQGIYFCEFDGPRQREVWIQISG